MLEGKRAGAWGAAGCFSFYPTKNLGALGDGGAIVTSDAGLAERARRLRQYGWASKYRSTLAGGRNSRLDEMQAALLAVKLPLVDGWNERRRAIARRYDEALAVSRARGAERRGAPVRNALARPRRGAGRAWRPPASAPTYTIRFPTTFRNRRAASRGPRAPLPVTEQCCREVLTVPCFPELTAEEVERVASALAAMC